MSTKKKLFICGHARHGKDQFAEFLSKHAGMTFESSSKFACRTVVRPYLSKQHGIEYESDDECFHDRMSHRGKWFEAINEFNSHDPAKLSRLIFAKYDMYVGIRSFREMEAARGIADASIWIDASHRCRRENTDSNTIYQCDCDLVVDNNGTLLELERKAINIARLLAA